jgi:hypothetical protein
LVRGRTLRQVRYSLSLEFVAVLLQVSVLIEKDDGYFAVAEKRLAEARQSAALFA